jgi:Asp/Glu/hydantoin racemase
VGRGREDDIKTLGRTLPVNAFTAKEAQEKGAEIIVLGYAGHSAILGNGCFPGLM